MKDRYILKKDHLTSFLRKAYKDFRLVTPVQNRHGDTLFAEIGSVDSMEMDLVNQPQNSIKEFHFPQQEVLFAYTAAKGTYTFTPVPDRNRPTIYFGVRPCDVSAILYMDVIFSCGGKDSHYFQRRSQSLLIGLNCNTPFENCFCNATRNGPFLEFGSALQLTDLGNRFMVEIGRARGSDLVQKWPQFFQVAEEKDVKAQYQLFLEARGKFKRQVHVDQAIRRLEAGDVPDALWQQLSLRCQDCGGCAYICPTCTCFSITDIPAAGESGQGERLRSWDACTFAGFTRMAGGHNPVNQKTEAIRQRFMHKLLYDVQRHGRPSCVGCGRCVGMCFGGTDIVRFIDMAGE